MLLHFGHKRSVDDFGLWRPHTPTVYSSNNKVNSRTTTKNSDDDSVSLFHSSDEMREELGTSKSDGSKQKNWGPQLVNKLMECCCCCCCYDPPEERERVGLNRKDKEMDGIEEEDA
jgi:hypothetical protein